MKRLISFRFSESTIDHLDYLAFVYTNGNRTILLERIIRRYWWLESLALHGKYRTPGFGINGSERSRIKDAWDLFITQVKD